MGAATALADITTHHVPTYGGTPTPTAPAPPPTEDLFYVLLAGGVWGPVTSAELADIADTTFALTGADVVVTQARAVIR